MERTQFSAPAGLRRAPAGDRTLFRGSADHHPGLSFRAYTNSFGTEDSDFRRLDENPLGLFVDTYFTKHLLLRVEGGYSLMRQVRGGELDPCATLPANVDGRYADHGVADAFHARLMLAYRFRSDE